MLWLRLWSAETAPIQPPAWEPPYAAGVAPKKTKKKKCIPFEDYFVPVKILNKMRVLFFFIFLYRLILRPSTEPKRVEGSFSPPMLSKIGRRDGERNGGNYIIVF